MGAYTALALLSVVLVVAYELLVARTGILATANFWISMAIVWFFQALVDGWLTKLSSPIVIYNGDEFSGWRVFWDSPVEDFAFGFSLVTLTLVLWLQLGPRFGDDAADDSEAAADADTEVE